MQRINIPETIINFIFVFIELLLGFRFLLKLLGANPSVLIVDRIYKNSSLLLKPFAEIIPSKVLQEGMILEFTTLASLIIYALINAIIIMTLRKIINPKKK